MNALNDLIHHMIGFLWLAYLAPAVILSFITYKLYSWYHKISMIRLIHMLKYHVDKGTIGNANLSTILDAKSYSEVKRHLKTHIKAMKLSAKQPK